MSTPDKKPVLLIGTFRNDKIKNEIYVAGREIISKNLTSSPNNWIEIIKFLDKNKGEISLVIVSLSESVLLIARCVKYRELFSQFLNNLKDFEHAIFIYEDNLFGKYNIFARNYYDKYLYYDVYHSSRETYKYLMQRYNEEYDELATEIVKKYLLEMIVPAAMLASDKEWERITFDENDEAFFQLSLLNSGLCDIDEFEISLDELREILVLTREEKSYYTNLSNQEKVYFIGRKLNECRSAKEALSNDDKVCEFLNDLIETEGTSPIGPNWTAEGWQLFKSYRFQHRCTEDAEVAMAITSMNNIIKEIQDKELFICAYKTSTDIVRVIREFFANESQAIVFRSYILRDQMWASELDEFLKLFQEYVTTIRGVNIVFEQNKTDIGVLYVMKSSKHETVRHEFSEYVHDFDSFLEKCEYDVTEARSILQSYNCDEKKIEFFISKFQIGARRLKTDMRQEYERKMLALRHCIENEALEEAMGTTLVDIQKQIALPITNPSMIIHFGNSFVVENSGELGQIIWGDYQYNETDKQLIELINKFSTSQDNLVTELNVLKDAKTSGQMKSTAWTKLKEFLTRNASTIGDIAFKLLSRYLEGLAQG